MDTTDLKKVALANQPVRPDIILIDDEPDKDPPELPEKPIPFHNVKGAGMLATMVALASAMRGLHVGGLRIKPSSKNAGGRLSGSKRKILAKKHRLLAIQKESRKHNRGTKGHTALKQIK